MDWLNIHTAFLDGPEYIGADPVCRATWLNLLRYCAGQENGGRISGCMEWSDRKWQQLVRVTKQEIETPCELWNIDSTDIVVCAYPVEKEAIVIARRNSGRAGGLSKSPEKIEAAKLNGALNQSKSQAEPKQTPKQTPKHNPSKHPTEWNGMEGERKENNTSCAGEPPQPPTPKKQKIQPITFNRQTMEIEFATPDVQAQIVAQWEKLFPGVDLRGEAKNAKAWLIGNPDKPRKNIHKFLTNWFGRSVRGFDNHNQEPEDTSDDE